MVNLDPSYLAKGTFDSDWLSIVQGRMYVDVPDWLVSMCSIWDYQCVPMRTNATKLVVLYCTVIVRFCIFYNHCEVAWKKLISGPKKSTNIWGCIPTFLVGLNASKTRTRVRVLVMFPFKHCRLFVKVNNQPIWCLL